MMKLNIVALGFALTAGSAMAADAIMVQGAGATFPYPIYGKWFEEFHKARPDVQINYQSVGSGAGIKQLTAGTVDFAASDKPMSDNELKATKVPTLHFPTVLGGVVPIYNIPGFRGDLKLTGDTLAGIYLGKITKWNDKMIAADNPGMPDKEIVIVHRSDSSGTSFIWTDYLSKVSADWKSGPGANAAVKWPVGLGGKGSEGVTGLVKQTPYSIGYVEMIFALQDRKSVV